MIKILEKDKIGLKEAPNLKITYGLPYDNLPAVLFTSTSGIPQLRLRFQISNLDNNELGMAESLSVISYYLEYILIEKLQYQWKYSLGVDLSFNTFKKFSFLELNISLSELGRRFINSIISAVFAGIEEVRKEYAMKNEFFDEIKDLMDMAFY